MDVVKTGCADERALLRRLPVATGCCVGLPLFVHGLEVDFAQMHRRKTGSLDDVGHIATEIGIHYLRTDNAIKCVIFLVWFIDIV